MPTGYSLSLPDYPKWVKILAWWFALSAILSGFAHSVIVHSYQTALFSIVSIVIPIFFHKRTGTPTPSNLIIAQGVLTIRDYPMFDSEFTRGVNHIIPEYSITLGQCNFEWVGSWLYLNQQSTGISTKLCQDGNPDQLTKWLQDLGYSIVGTIPGAA